MYVFTERDVYVAVDGRYPEHYYPQYAQHSSPSWQRGRGISDANYRAAIDPYVTLTPSERAKFRPPDSGDLSVGCELLSQFSLPS